MYLHNLTQTGEHQEWAKYSAFGVATQVPWMVSDPSTSPGVRKFKHIPVLQDNSQAETHEPWVQVDNPVSLLDLMPTLAEASGTQWITFEFGGHTRVLLSFLQLTATWMSLHTG